MTAHLGSWPCILDYPSQTQFTAWTLGDRSSCKHPEAIHFWKQFSAACHHLP